MYNPSISTNRPNGKLMQVQVTTIYPEENKWRFIVVHGDATRGYEFKTQEEAEKVRKQTVKNLMTKGFKVIM